MPWELNGNSSTRPPSDFLGTTDQQPLVVTTGGREALRVDPAGRVGIGTTSPAATAEIVGNWTGREGALRVTGDRPTLKLAGGAIAGNQSWIVHVGGNGPGDLEFYRQGATPESWGLVMSLTRDGNVVVTSDIQLTGADYAEEFDLIDAEVPDPGTVMVLDESGVVRVSDSTYDHRVAGVISGAGGYKPAVITDRREARSTRRAVALMGKVHCKVDADYYPVGVGDLRSGFTYRYTLRPSIKPENRHRRIVSKPHYPTLQRREESR